MRLQDAQDQLQQLLHPMPMDRFLDTLAAGGVTRVEGDPLHPRTQLLGPDPQRLLLDGFDRLATKLTFHSAQPFGPPPPSGPAASRGAFRKRIETFHARGYSVRFPELRPLSPELDRVARALEVVLHQPVTASAFWSQGGLKAPVHYDDHDILVIQLRGEKRWYVSDAPAGLHNSWKTIPGAPPSLGPHQSFVLRPGDFAYLPRGAFHTVDADTESLHLAIGFIPLTVRDAIIAALDQLSDLDRSYRETITGRLAFQLRGEGLQGLAPRVLDGVARLHSACASPGFFQEALQRRSARTVAVLPALPAPAVAPPIDLDTVLRPRDVAFCHLSANAETIDFSYPGGHLYIHRGAEQSLVFMTRMPEFTVRDVPGALADDVKLALAAKLVGVGYLEASPAVRVPGPPAVGALGPEAGEPGSRRPPARGGPGSRR